MNASALILCGGFGTRLGGARAKALLEVGGRPVLDFLVEQLLQVGLYDLAIVTNERDRPEFLAWAQGWTQRLPAAAEICVYGNGCEAADQRLGAVGDLAFLLERAKPVAGAALVAAGDNIFEFSLGPFWREFEIRARSMVLAVPDRDVERLRKTGVLELGDGERVLGLTEKPRSPAGCWTCPPLYSLMAADLALVHEYLRKGFDGDEIGRFIGFLARSGKLWAFPVAGSRLDIGTREALLRAREVVGRGFELKPGGRLTRSRIAKISSALPD